MSNTRYCDEILSDDYAEPSTSDIVTRTSRPRLATKLISNSRVKRPARQLKSLPIPAESTPEEGPAPAVVVANPEPTPATDTPRRSLEGALTSLLENMYVSIRRCL